ncbi:MAG: histidine triad nucleotide-binding protein [Bdellovibrionales bacterium]
MTYDNQNIFAKILRGEIPSTAIYEDQYVYALSDIAPQAPVHILVIPKGAYISIDDFGATATPDEITAFYRAIAKIAADAGLSKDGYRVIANTGAHGGQEVPHFHAHILGGEKLTPMLAG